MKKIFLISLSLLLSFHFSYSQNATPNPGFEDWTFVDFFGQFYIPNSWDNLDSATAIIGILTCQQTTDKHSGQFAVKLLTQEVIIFGTDTANGIITTGNLIVIPPYGIEGGIPYTERPDSIAGWFKYTPAPGDSTQIQFDLFTNAGDTIGTALIQIGQTVTGYTRFSAPVVYQSSGTPELSRWLISSSNGYNALPGSVLYVDDISLIFTTGVNEIENSSGLGIHQTIESEVLWLSNPKHVSGNLTVYNTLGNALAVFPLSGEHQEIHLPAVANQILVCSVTDNNGALLLSKKIVVQH
jgi:hypothetical protein